MSIAQSPSVGSEGFGSSPMSVFYFFKPCQCVVVLSELSDCYLLISLGQDHSTQIKMVFKPETCL